MATKYVDIQCKLTERESATDYPSLTKTWKDFDFEMEESTGLSTYVIAGGVGPTALSLGSIVKGRLLVLFVEKDETNGFEPLSVLINGSATLLGTSFVLEFDETTGLTSVSVTNPGTNSISFQYYVGGDIA